MKRWLVVVGLFTVALVGCNVDTLDKIQVVDQRMYEVGLLHAAVVNKSADAMEKTEASRYSLERSVIDKDMDSFLDKFDESGRLVSEDENGEKKPISKAEIKRIMAERDRRLISAEENHRNNAQVVANLRNEMATYTATLNLWIDKKSEWTAKQKQIANSINAAINTLVGSGIVGVAIGAAL